MAVNTSVILFNLCRYIVLYNDNFEFTHIIWYWLKLTTFIINKITDAMK